jgi:3-oxoadipate enol-lactonase
VPYIHLSSGLSIHYLKINLRGSPTVLLIHGLGADGSSWALQLPALEKAGFCILAPDIRGFGKSNYIVKGMHIPEIASDLAVLLDQMQSVPAHVVGISMGGMVALQLALDFPHQVNKLVLINTFACLRPHKPRFWLYFALRFLLVHTLGLPTQARFVVRRIFPLPEQAGLRSLLYAQIIQSDPAAYRAMIRAIARFNVLSRLQEIRQPVLVITGDRDNTVPAQTQVELAAGIPSARQVFITDAGHAVIAEKPDLINRFLLDFLNEDERLPWTPKASETYLHCFPPRSP